MVKEMANRQPNAALAEAKKKARLKLAGKQSPSTNVIMVKDIYHAATSSLKKIRGLTGLIYDKRMADHCCLWDSNYPECPERFTQVLDR